MGTSSPTELATEVVASFVSNNPLPKSELPALIHAIHATVARLAAEQNSAPPQIEPKAPRLVNVPHSVSVHANVPKGGAEGVLFSMGGVDGGFAFYVQGGKLTYGYNYVADQRFKVQSDKAIPEGDHIFSFEFKPTGKADIAKGKGVPASVTLLVDGAPVGKGDLPVTIPLSLGLSAGVCVGSDAGAPVMCRS